MMYCRLYCRCFPSTVTPLIRSIVIQVYTQSGGIIPVSIVVALWSAGKGVLSVTSGLNCIYANIETRNYIYLRLRASLYTVIFLLAIMLSLVLSVFGNSISVMLYEHLPFLSRVVDFIIRIRTFVTLVVLTAFWDLVYKFLPNRKKPRQHDAAETAAGGRCSLPADGCSFHLFFQSIWIFLPDLRACTEVSLRSSLSCSGSTAVCISYFWAGR